MMADLSFSTVLCQRQPEQTIYLLTHIQMLSEIHLVLELTFCNTKPREREFSTHIMHLNTSTNPILIQDSEKRRVQRWEQTYLQIPICNLEDTSRRYGGNNFPHKIILLKGNTVALMISNLATLSFYFNIIDSFVACSRNTFSSSS